MYTYNCKHTNYPGTHLHRHDVSLCNYNNIFTIKIILLDVVLLLQYSINLVIVGKTSVAMDATEELSRTDEENK